MCNEFRIQFVEGAWRWVHLHKGGGSVVSDGDKDFNFGAPKQYSWNAFPDRMAPVVRLDADGLTEMIEMRWGFPSPQPGGRPVTNVRNLNSSYWRKWLAPEYRCLVPITEFCEWTETTPKQKKWFKLKDDAPFMFAGIYRPWTGVRGPKSAQVDGEHLLFAFLTCAPNVTVGAIHAKAMPVMLKPEQWMDWLTAPTEGALTMAQPFPDEDMAPPI